MRVATMRAVDRALGRPLCFLLTILRRLLPKPRAVAPEDVRSVLFVKLSEMGAVVLAAPAIHEVQRVFPNAKPWLLCFDENREIAGLAAGIDDERIIVAETSGLFGTLFAILGAALRVRRQRFDVVVDLEYFSRVSAILSHLSGAPVRSGFHRFSAEGLYCGDLYTHRVTFNPYLHIAQSMVVLVRAAARPASETPLAKCEAPTLGSLQVPRFEPGDDERASIEKRLAESGVPDGAELLLVNPNSSDLLPLRRWPRDRFVSLCRELRARRPGSWVVLTGAPHEAQLGQAILADLRSGDGGDERVISWIGNTSLRELLVLMHRAVLLVSADSGPPHFAALTPIRGITLFGPETPALYGPITTNNRALTLGLSCSPCINAWNRRVSDCTANVCMTGLSAEIVADAAMAQLDA